MKLPESKADLGSGTFDSTIVLLRSMEVTSHLGDYVEGATTPLQHAMLYCSRRLPCRAEPAVPMSIETAVKIGLESSAVAPNNCCAMLSKQVAVMVQEMRGTGTKGMKSQRAMRDVQ